MIYVMSDIHGCYDEYVRMLEIIHFCDRDTLFVLGDVVDRGPEPMKVLFDMSMRSNVYPILGNHEIATLNILKPLMVEIKEDNYNTHITEDLMSNIMEYQSNGGNVTMEKFRGLSIDDREFMLEYIEEFSPYEIVDVSGKTFVLVHGGLGNYRIDKTLDDYTLEELCFSRPNYDEPIFDGTECYVICGHTPTLAITGEPKVIHKNHYINIDCGACFPEGKLACICLDNMNEYYV